MPSSKPPAPITDVQTYDGHRAATKPRIVIFESIEYEVVECLSLYISTGEHASSPVKRGYQVRCRGGRQFKLELTEGHGWQVDPLPGPHLM